MNTAFDPDCCIISPPAGVPPPQVPGRPQACSPDLYHQVMRYNGLDIERITIGSACGFMMRNDYKYDALPPLVPGLR